MTVEQPDIQIDIEDFLGGQPRSIVHTPSVRYSKPGSTQTLKPRRQANDMSDLTTDEWNRTAIKQSAIERAQGLLRSLSHTGLLNLLFETEAGKTYQELLALTMIKQDEASAKLRERSAKCDDELPT
jgi:hypothetical protein